MFQQAPSSQSYVDQLWADGRRSYSDLNQYEIDKLTGFLMLEAAHCDGRKWHHEFLIETDNLEEIAKRLATLLINPDSKAATEIFITAARKGACSYAKSFIDSLFENLHHYRRAA